MSVGLSFAELLTWNDEASRFWKEHLETHPKLLALPCGIGGAKDVQMLVKHVWAADLRWAQRLAGVPETAKEAIPEGPLEALYAFHDHAVAIYRELLTRPAESWEESYTLNTPALPEPITMSRRKVMGHALFHGQRHWAQLATLVRNAGFPSDFRGDMLFSKALR